MKFQTLDLEMHHGIAIIWLNRPEMRNAITDVVVTELHAALDAVDRDISVRAVMLAGRGTVFCAGIDVNEMRATASRSARAIRNDALNYARLLQKLDTLSKPTVCRVHGAAMGGGIGLVVACDIAVSTHEAVFRIAGVRLGLVPALVMPYIVNAIGERNARRYVLSGEAFSAAEAYRIGMVQDIAPSAELDKKIEDLLGELLKGGPGAIAAAKDLIRTVTHAPAGEKLLATTLKRAVAARTTDEAREGVLSFLEKRSPAWADPDRSAKATRKKTTLAKKS